MNPLRQGRWAWALCAAWQLAVFPLFAGVVSAAASPPGLPPAPSTTFSTASPFESSPIVLFRQLLAMRPDEREIFLTNRPPEIRKRILVKVNEYEALDPNTRELRLRATELRWYLMPLLREPPTDRAARLAQVPEDIRELVEDRLNQWTILPPPLQQEFLENERTLHYFTSVDVSGSLPENAGRKPGDGKARGNALSEIPRRQITTEFNQFFELTPREKQKVLGTLSDVERQQMEKTLQSFDKLPSQQREECVRAFAKFAGMSAADRAEFLRNAQHWSQMPPAERQAWRDLVVNVPKWPPLPPGFTVPPPPPPLPPGFHPIVVATNSN
jgi:Protein of unknown function (DUF3106)